ncbi:PAS domain S-box protein, partial [Magnetococcales bacterium HHB-1]
APVIYIWVQQPYPIALLATRFRRIEFAILLIGVTFVSVAVFFSSKFIEQDHFLLPYLTFPFLAWAALRFEQHGASLVSFILATLAIWATVNGYGPFYTHTTASRSVLSLQAFLCISIITTMCIAILTRIARKRLDKLLISQERLTELIGQTQSLMALSPVGIFHTDKMGRCLYVNETWSQIAGLTAEEAKGEGWIDGLYEADRQTINEAWSIAVEQQKNFRLEYRFQRPDGKMTWVLGQATEQRNNAGEIIGYIGTITDITKRKKIEEALRQNRARWKGLVENSPDYIITLDHRFHIVFINRPLLGLKKAQIIGTRLPDLIPDQCRMVTDALTKALTEQKQITYETAHRSVDGHQRHF